MISASLIKQLKIPTHRTLTLKFGSRKIKLRVSPIARSKKPFLRYYRAYCEPIGTDRRGCLIATTYDRRTQTLKLGP